MVMQLMHIVNLIWPSTKVFLVNNIGQICKVSMDTSSSQPMVKGVKGQGRVKFLITSNGQTSRANMLALDKHAQLAIVSS